jgi:tetratricopeptide (TPR) repeat protein
VIGTFEVLRLTSKVELPESGRPTADGGVEVLANQALTFELAFSGKGNLKMVKKPTLNWPSDFEVFDPEVEGPIKTDPTGQSGTQKFRYTVIPRAAGTFRMPDVELVYFNPLRKRMEPLSAKGKRVTVLPDFTTQGGSMSFNAKSDVQTLHQDIRYIELEAGRVVARSSARDMRSLVWWLIFLGPMIYAVCWLDERRKRREQSDSRGTKERKAARSLRAALKRSGDAEAIGQAVELYLMAKLGWDQSGYQRSLAIAAIAENRPELARAWNDFLAELEMARYAPGVVSGSATEWNARAMELMKSMEKPNRQVAGILGVLIGCGLAISAFSATGQSPVEIAFLEANLAYADGDFDEAIVGYETVLQTHFFFAAEYNLGNAYYKTEQLAPAILHYERAALINPRNGDLAMNLALAQVRTIDRIEELPTQGLRDFWSQLTAPGFWRYWAWTLVLIWTSGFIVLAIRIRLRELATRRMAGSVGIALLALGLITMPIALTCEEEATIDRFAIVMTPTAEVLNAPSGASESGSSEETATAQPLFLLHEGTKFEVLGSSGDWWEIRLANGNVGWIFAESAELI